MARHLLGSFQFQGLFWTHNPFFRRLIHVCFACVDSESRDELFKHREDNERSRCTFWGPGFQSGLGSSLPACVDLIIPRFHFCSHCKRHRAPRCRCMRRLSFLLNSLAATERRIVRSTLRAHVIAEAHHAGSQR